MLEYARRILVLLARLNGDEGLQWAGAVNEVTSQSGVVWLRSRADLGTFVHFCCFDSMRTFISISVEIADCPLSL